MATLNLIWRCVMAENITKLPVKKEGGALAAQRLWAPFESLRREIDRLFEDFDGGWRSPFGRSLFDVQPFRSRETTRTSVTAGDVAETKKAYKITAELPGIEEKN